MNYLFLSSHPCIHPDASSPVGQQPGTQPRHAWPSALHLPDLLPQGSILQLTMVILLGLNLMCFGLAMATSMVSLWSPTPTQKPPNYDIGSATWNWISSWGMKVRSIGLTCLQRVGSLNCSNQTPPYTPWQLSILMNLSAFVNMAALFNSQWVSLPHMWWTREWMIGTWDAGLGHNAKDAKAPLPALFQFMSHAGAQGKKLFIGSKFDTFGGMASSLALATSFFMI